MCVQAVSTSPDPTGAKTFAALSGPTAAAAGACGAIPESSESHARANAGGSTSQEEGGRRNSIDAMWAELESEAAADDSDDEL